MEILNKTKNEFCEKIVRKVLSKILIYDFNQYSVLEIEDFDTGRIYINFDNNEFTSSTLRIWDIVTTKNKSIVSWTFYFYKDDPIHGETKIDLKDDVKKFKLNNNKIFVISEEDYVDKNNNRWICTPDGVTILSSKTQKSLNVILNKYVDNDGVVITHFPFSRNNNKIFFNIFCKDKSNYVTFSLIEDKVKKECYRLNRECKYSSEHIAIEIIGIVEKYLEENFKTI